MSLLAPVNSEPKHPLPYSWRNYHPNANFHYIRDPDQANHHLALLHGPVGFDLEWRPTFAKGLPDNPVSLVQLANHETILLIQISAMQTFPAKLQEFLENPDVVKAGVAIQNDVKKLYKDWQVSTRNCVDLSLLARSVDNNRWKGKYSNPLGLARLIDTYHDLLLPKGKITRSNWESELSIAQQEYAGNDAHAGYLIYKTLVGMAQEMPTIPKSVYYTFDAIEGILCDPSGSHWLASNPDYDPGPPPPPRVPKPPRSRDIMPRGLVTVNVHPTNPAYNAGDRRPFSAQADISGSGRHQRPQNSPSGSRPWNRNTRQRFTSPPPQESSSSTVSHFSTSAAMMDAPQPMNSSAPPSLPLAQLAKRPARPRPNWKRYQRESAQTPGGEARS